ncbi:hypothetical protein [Nocardiopsis synnemataformans]|uniref:hypothetical protein n=1 Tax=Nocardiopsis synnemataformans TaxID=61305 RepID=UPI003EBEC56F
MTARDIYAVAMTTQGDVRRLVERMETQEKRAEEREHDHDEAHTDYENRLRALEKWRWGIGAAVGLALLAIAGGDTSLSSLIP